MQILNGITIGATKAAKIFDLTKISDQKFLYFLEKQNNPIKISYTFPKTPVLPKLLILSRKNPTPPKPWPPKFLILSQKKTNQIFYTFPDKPTSSVRFKEPIIRPNKFFILFVKKLIYMSVRING